jgi:anti-sigma regulatory factor (Ser/Thr protein kinase)
VDDAKRRERSFERTLAAVAPLLDWLDEEAPALSIGPDALRSLQLAIEEIFANCVRHNPGGKGPIDVCLELDGGRVRVAIVDPDTDRFDLRAAAEARTELPLEQRRPGGLGIHFVRAIVDEIDYRHEGRRAVTVLVKNLE